MNKSKEIYFHLGLPKTASTYLQRSVFPFLENIKYYKKHDYHYHKKDFETINNKVLFTCEMDETLFEELDELKKIHPNANIIIVFREHFDWIKSKYKYYIRKSGHLSFIEFYEGILIPKLKLHQKYYTSIIKKLEMDFPSKYLILSHSMLKENRYKFLKIMHDFMGIEIQNTYKYKKVKTAFSNKQLVVLRKYNSLYLYDENRFKSEKKRKLYEKYRGALVFLVAFFASLNPNNGDIIDSEISESKEEIRSFFKDDWDYVNQNL